MAACIALGNLRLLELPSGGSISLAMLPLIVLAAARGPRTAASAGLAAGLGHALSGGAIVHPAQLVLDYGVAYAAPAFAGLGTSMAAIRMGIILSSLVQLLATSLSGVLFFVPPGTANAWLYSATYNAATIVPELCMALALAPVIVGAYARAQPRSRLGLRWRASHQPVARQPRMVIVPAPPTRPAEPPATALAARTPSSFPRHTPLTTHSLRLDDRPGPLVAGG